MFFYRVIKTDALEANIHAASRALNFSRQFLA